MGDSGSGSRSTSGNLGAPASPLRIYTRVNGGEHKDDFSPEPRDANAMLGGASSRIVEDGSEHGSRPSSSHAAAGRTGRAAAPRSGRHGTHYHPLPSHWRGQESSPSSVGSPVTPDSGGSEEIGMQRMLPLVSTLSSQMAYTPEPFRPFHNSHTYNSIKARPGREPSLYALGDACGSVSSLDWANDRPGSTHSYRSVEQSAHFNDVQAESPLESPGHNGRFPPALGALAARSGATQRSALGVHTGPSRHHPSASTSS
ncbi:hypothetical protein GGF47_003969, partial [Coemansia sp. RSA 2524]